MKLVETAFSQGIVTILELRPESRALILKYGHLDDAALNKILAPSILRRTEKKNLVFNYPREQYAKLDRGETPDAIDASYLTLATISYLDPSVTTVAGESLRVPTTTRIAEATNPKNSIVRFMLDVGQFVGSWTTMILIGGTGATSTPGTGYILAAANNVKDDSNAPISRDGTTLHLVNWTMKHLDSSEV